MYICVHMAQYSPSASSGSLAMPVSIKGGAQFTVFFHCLHHFCLQSLCFSKGKAPFPTKERGGVSEDSYKLRVGQRTQALRGTSPGVGMW